MIGIDTNILVRAFLEDDAVQAQTAQAFLKNNSIFISSYAILEFAWVLKVKKFTRKEIYDAIITLVDSPSLTIGQREVITTALEKYSKGKADFGDYMIIAEGEQCSSRRFVTFDKVVLNEVKTATHP
ncbi:type II toxin-antitoxin system VapC family toxin [Rickettsia endosymbiont of Halotydeus destructor]|uniref:type II toxin-antitoxin system VapC family toxin n=1 Tax=Rickettsia endosymbiont of Halotydeus destructor TaxID=2996754 RepID=UPI003BAE8F39